MRWQGRRESGNVEDRRGRGAGLALGGGLASVVVVVIALLAGVDPRDILVSSPSADTSPGQGGGAPADDPQARFVSVVLADTEDTWHRLLPPLGRDYQNPRLVLFTDSVSSGCGMASAAVGPFYCSRDATVYIDLGFFHELDARFGAPGDFARAYVVAHEIGHHVQNLLGIAEDVERRRASGSEERANALSVRLELQADCLAGVWGNQAGRQQDFLDPGDVEEGLRAAAAIGDDRLQRQAQGYVVPESFTHGSSEQRVDWLRRGLESGDPQQCDTFAGS